MKVWIDVCSTIRLHALPLKQGQWRAKIEEGRTIGEEVFFKQGLLSFTSYEACIRLKCETTLIAIDTRRALIHILFSDYRHVSFLFLSYKIEIVLHLNFLVLTALYLGLIKKYGQ